MLSDTDYAVAWSVYLLGSAGLLFLVFWSSRGWTPGLVRTLCRFLPAPLLLVPARADVEQTALAPALIVAAFEFTMTSEPEAGKLALVRLGYALAGFALILIALQVRRRYFLTK